MNTIDELQARQDEIRGRLQEIDRAAAGAPLDDESRAEWNKLNEEFESNEKLLAELIARRDRVEQLNGSERHTEPDFQIGARTGRPQGEDIYDLSTIRASAAGPQEALREMRDRALQAIERNRPAHPEVDEDRARAHAEALVRHTKEAAELILRTGSPTYRRGFAKVLAGQPCSPEEQRALGLANEKGGYAVPFVLDPTILGTSNGVVNPVRQIARVEPITGANEWRGVAAGSVQAAYVEEGAEAEDKAPTLAGPTIKAHRAQTFVPYSIEIEGDWSRLEAEVAKLISEGKDELEATAFLSGTGEGQPQGVLTGATEVIETGTKESFKTGDLYALKGKLPPRYRTNSAWLANDAIYDRVRQFDNSGGADLWVRLGEGRPPELIGRPAYELSTMASNVDAGGAKILIFGDFSRYVIVERLGMTVEVIPHLFGEGGAPVGRRGLYAIWRNGAAVVDKNAFRVLKVKKE